MPSKIQQLRDEIRQIIQDGGGDWERIHGDIDDAMERYIGDEEVSKLLESITRWYA